LWVVGATGCGDVGVDGYIQDLAYVHDGGFRDYALSAAPGLLQILRRNGVAEGLIVDLGCGSGRWAAELTLAGYKVVGVDQSRAMVALARRIAPAAKFRVASLWGFKLPVCDAVTSIGECLNYCFDASNSRRALQPLFRRVYRALRPGGAFVFDVAEPGRLPGRMPQKNWLEGRDWAILVSVGGDREHNMLRRKITCFRKIGKLFRRSEETHTLRLYRSRDLIEDLSRCGFVARKVNGYGSFRFPAGISGVVAIKPSA
jgi:SAM-dependent methyltransferase